MAFKTYKFEIVQTSPLYLVHKIIKLQMRTKKELLQLLLDNIDLMHSGLCGANITLHSKSLITLKEYLKLMKYLNKNLPKRILLGYCWIPNLKEPRIKWLKDQINTPWYLMLFK